MQENEDSGFGAIVNSTPQIYVLTNCMLQRQLFRYYSAHRILEAEDSHKLSLIYKEGNYPSLQ